MGYIENSKLIGSKSSLITSVLYVSQLGNLAVCTFCHASEIEANNILYRGGGGLGAKPPRRFSKSVYSAAG